MDKLCLSRNFFRGNERNIRTFSVLAMILGLLFFSTAKVSAVGNEPSANSPAPTGQTRVEERLTETKLKVCQNREAAIQQRSTRLVKATENMLTKFDQIASRVKQYYTNKVIPSGKTVAGYDALVAEISAKKKVVEEDLQKATTAAQAISCTSSNPREQLQQFRADMQQVKKDLKEYRAAIKNLIVAVRTVTGATESSASPKNNQ